MTDQDLEALKSRELRAWVSAHRNNDPQRLAFQRHEVGFPIRLAIAQIALLQKAAVKLPKMTGCQCILTQRSYEQSTSEMLSASKPWGKGHLALDLTCGLGSDSFSIADHYERVVSLEPDAQLAAIVRFNADLLGKANVEVVETKAEEFLASYDGTPFDLIYADPDRRDAAGKRVYGLEDCQPNVLALLPLMRRHGKRILVKGSPMLDIAAVQRLFPQGNFIWVLSEGNECKEILIAPDAEVSGVGAIFIRKGQCLSSARITESKFYPTWDVNSHPEFIFEADTALYQTGLVHGWMESAGLHGGMAASAGYYFSLEDDSEFHGNRFGVLADWPWKPQLIKSALKARGITKIQYAKRDFDLPMEQARKQIGLPEGGELFLLLTRYGEKGRWAFLANRIV